MTPETVRMTREELYELVWSEPMARLAPQFGLSDVGLKKTCKRMRVPTPGLGYWRRKEVGHAVKKTPLPKLPISAPQDLKEVTLRRRADADGEHAEPAGPVARQQAFESAEENKIRVAKTLDDPHPLVARTVLALRKAKPGPQGYLEPKGADCLSMRVSLDSADRAMCIFDALIKALDSRGFVTSIQPGREHPNTMVRVHDEDISISLSERIDRKEVKSNSIADRVSHWSSPRYEWVATNQLTLSITSGWSDGLRRTWSDGKKQRVEECLNAFIVGLVAVSEEERVRRLEREERNREWRAQEERRAAEAQHREEEAARIRALDHAVDLWLTARHIRGYVEGVRTAAERSGGLADGSDLQAWVKWAEAYADGIDPLLPVPEVPEDPEPNRRSHSW